MNSYTEMLTIRAETLSPDDDAYEESLLETAGLFRGFGEALTEFISEHGYRGDQADIPAKVQFLRERFKTAQVRQPRDFKQWFQPGRRIARRTAYQICFAFGLNVEETKDFFRCVQLERSFDCHTISEAVYYFCISNGFSYGEARELLDQLPAPEKRKTIPDQEIRYTGTILRDLNGIHDKKTLLEYLTDNLSDFRYNNATAITYIRQLWADISGAEGLAAGEGALINAARNRSRSDGRKGEEDRRFAAEDYAVAGTAASTWTIFSQILGLPNYLESKYAAQYDRSISSVLTGNVLMPLNAAYCFPSQHSIDALLRGETGDNEMIRKMLILLVFYTYWANILIRTGDLFFTARHADSERCLDTINGRLLDAGYPEIYAGNPYDWLFLWSLNDEHPLDAFHSYIGEVFAVKSESYTEE